MYIDHAYILEVRKILKFKVRKFKSDFPPREMTQNYHDGKGVSALQKLCDFFIKMVSKNNDFIIKNMKNT